MCVNWIFRKWQTVRWGETYPLQCLTSSPMLMMLMLASSCTLCSFARSSLHVIKNNATTIYFMLIPLYENLVNLDSHCNREHNGNSSTARAHTLQHYMCANEWMRERMRFVTKVYFYSFDLWIRWVQCSASLFIRIWSTSKWFCDESEWMEWVWYKWRISSWEFKSLKGKR